MIHPRRYIRRAWRSRGHGVHSPLAYRMITCVLRGRGAYYATAQIARGHDPRWHLLLMRLICDASPRHIHLPTPTDPTLSLIRHADTRITLTPQPCEFNIHLTPPPSLADYPNGITVIRTTTPAQRRNLLRTLPHGMTFTNGHTLIAVLRPDLTRQDFEIKFK